jgi:hypothetical protein
MMHKRAHHFSLLELDFNQHSNQLTANIFPTAKHSPQITVTVKDPLQIHSLPSTTTGVIIIVHFSVGDTPSKHIIIR